MPIHKDSTIALLPQLELWSLPPVQVSIAKDVATEYRPLSTLRADAPIEFNTHFGVGEYLNFYETYLHMRVQYTLKHLPGTTKATNNVAMTVDDWANLIPANYLLHAMFSHIDIQINGKSIVNSPQNYHIRAHLEALLAYSKSAKKSVLNASLWEEDDAKRSEAVRPLSSAVDKTKGRVIDLMGRLHVDLSNQGRLLVGGNYIKFRLVPNDVKVFTKIVGNYTAEISFVEAKLRTRASLVTPALLVAHQKALSINPARYQITRSEIKIRPIAKDTLDVSWDNCYIGHLPRRMFLVLVTNDALNGSFSHDLFSYKHHNLNYAAAFVDGVQFPSAAYQPNFEEGLYVREFMALYRALDQNGSDTYLELSYADYLKDRIVIPFQLSPDCSNGAGAEGHLSPSNIGTLRMDIRFKKPVTTPLNAILLCQFDDMIELDEHQNVKTSFN